MRNMYSTEGKQSQLDTTTVYPDESGHRTGIVQLIKYSVLKSK